MVRIIVKGEPGSYYTGGKVQWDGRVVGKVIMVKDNGDAICEIKDSVYEEITKLEISSMSCRIDTFN